MDAAREIRLGVTGHRSFARPHDVADAVDRVFDTLPRPGVVVSALAEGADRLVAHRALERLGWSLVAVLPMALADYEEDFDEPSRSELAQLMRQASEVEELQAGADRDEAYLQGGRRVVDRSDALVAIWDGRPAFGKGGTAEVVGYARELGRPVAWITATNTVREVAGDPEGKDPILWERWPWEG